MEWQKQLFEVMQHSALWAVVIFSILFPIRFFASNEFKTTLSLWFKGDCQSTWAEQFGNWFDGLFGEKHWSPKCVLRSIIASLLCVFSLYLIFTWQLGERPGSPIPLKEVFLIGLSVNVIADYASLLQSRWFLRLIPTWERISQRFVSPVWGSVLCGMLWLVLDLLVSACIIWAILNLYFLVTDTEPPSWGMLFGIYSIYAVFFYSSFFTTLWAVLFFLSTATVRLTSSLFQRPWWSSDNYPYEILCFLSAAWVFLIVFGFQGAQKQGAFDNLLCQSDARVCIAQANLSKTEQEQLNFLSKACLSGAVGNCMNTALKYFKGDNEKTARLLAKACSVGESRSCTNLGWMYNNGTGVDQDNGKAVTLYRQACDSGEAVGCTNLGIMYNLGTGVDQDNGKAVTLYRQACDSGETLGCTNLGTMYRLGTGVDQDNGKAVTLYRQVCDSGDARGCTNLGWMYENGTGVDQDYDKAVALFRQACDSGEAIGCFNLKSKYNYGTGVDQDNGRAVILFRQACDSGEALGCNNLGTMYNLGTGVDQDKVKAAALFRQGCDGGNAQGCNNLGWMYIDGTGVDQGKEEAAILFRQACDGGNVQGCTNLGWMYETGTGVDQDKAEAVVLFRQACDMGLKSACRWAAEKGR